MSDFSNNFWGWFIGIVTVAGVLACAWITHWMSGGRAEKGGETQPETQVETMGHVWDEDLTEFNNPLPAWWKNLFYITIAFALVYLVLYPGLGHFAGLLGWSGQSQYESEVKQAQAQYGPLYQKYAAMRIEALGSNPQALKIGERLYLSYCTGCHGSDAGGVVGFPNLRDNDWLYGGEPAQIKASILNGRRGIMPGWQAALGEQGVHEVTQYVLDLSHRPGIDEQAAEAGRDQYNALCASCHLPDGKGLQALGAPNLTDNIWLYGGSVEQVAHSIAIGRAGVMPAHKELLGEEKAHLIAAYIYRLSQ